MCHLSLVSLVPGQDQPEQAAHATVGGHRHQGGLRGLGGPVAQDDPRADAPENAHGQPGPHSQDADDVTLLIIT